MAPNNFSSDVALAKEAQSEDLPVKARMLEPNPETKPAKPDPIDMDDDGMRSSQFILVSQRRTC